MAIGREISITFGGGDSDRGMVIFLPEGEPSCEMQMTDGSVWKLVASTRPANDSGALDGDWIVHSRLW